MKILVLGAGGTGGYFGGRLAQAGSNVTFLVREKRAAQLARDGLIIESPHDKITLRVASVLAKDVKPEYDLIILSCKAYDLDSAIAAIAPAMGPHACIVPLLNGMTHMAALDLTFGRQRVMGGVAQIAATLTPAGHVKSLADVHLIVWGARETSQQPLASALGEAFAKTIVDWKVSDNIEQEMWEKVVFLSTLAGMTCLMRGSIGEILSTPDGKALMERFVAGNIAIAEREGFAPRPPVIERFRNLLNTTGSPLTASMLRDLENGGAIEADHIVGFMLGRARHHGTDDTLLGVAYTHLKTYEARQAAGRLPKVAD